MFLIIAGDGMKPVDPLSEALRTLPMAEPPQDLFAQVSRDLKSHRPRRRWIVPTALAASMVLGLLLVLPNASDKSTAVVQSAAAPRAMQATASTSEIDRLRADSRVLETWLGGLTTAAPRDGRSLMASAEIEDLVGLIDVQLSAARNETESLPLWRQRVALLEDLASIRSGPLASMAYAGFAEASGPNAF